MVQVNFNFLKNKKNLSNQIIKNSNYFVSELKKHPELKNIRHCGYLIAMDFETKRAEEAGVDTDDEEE